MNDSCKTKYPAVLNPNFFIFLCDHMEDSAIVDLYWQRSEQAISETDRKYGRYCHTIAYNICADNEDAEECVNDTWFSAWNSMPDKRPSVLSTFLGYITRNFAIDRFKLNNARKRGGGEMPLALDELEECISSPVDPAQEIEQKELESAVDAFVSGLSDTERRMFIARYWFLIPVAEISERMGCSQSKTKTTLYRTRNKLRTYLQGEGLC